MSTSALFATDASKWDAVLNRDRAAEGIFYLAVKSTGVYCRPGCPSRLPRRENSVFYDTRTQAEQAGYRPCKRCRPDALSPAEELTALVVRACRRIEGAERPLSLSELATEAGLSPSHFQRVFKERVGVSPRQYAAAHQARRFQDSLQSSASVTEAVYEAGFGSSSRAYESARRNLAMAPSAYRNGAPGVVIEYGVADSALGCLLVAATEQGLCAIEFVDQPDSATSLLHSSFPKATLVQGGLAFNDTIRQVIAFVESPATGLDLPLDIQGTAFQLRVWSALRAIPPGSTRSYGDIARQIGNPTAVRAVAQACAANKLAVAVPCHRVIAGDGKLAGYRGGVARKQALLEREGAF
jgi:AraC family transcriptional regulator of adaptative response/methylated-DNA-[protein]-cysteine methyltransferase